jgi:hypothetical protein
MAFIIWLRKESDNIVKSSIHCGAPYVTGAAWKFTKMTFSFQITYTSWSISSILVILHSVGPIYGHDKESATIMLMAEVNKQTTMKISKMLHLAKNLLWCVMGVFAWLEHNHSPPPKQAALMNAGEWFYVLWKSGLTAVKCGCETKIWKLPVFVGRSDTHEGWMFNESHTDELKCHLNATSKSQESNQSTRLSLTSIN